MQGYCCAPRCWNTPHAWQLGWISVQQLDGSRLKAGQTVTARLPSQSVTATGAGLRILPDWVPRWNDPQAGTAPLFVGFRTKQGGDAQLFDLYAGKANVYTSAIANGRDPAGSVLEASLAGELAHAVLRCAAPCCDCLIDRDGSLQLGGRHVLCSSAQPVCSLVALGGSMSPSARCFAATSPCLPLSPSSLQPTRPGRTLPLSWL